MRPIIDFNTKLDTYPDFWRMLFSESEFTAVETEQSLKEPVTIAAPVKALKSSSPHYHFFAVNPLDLEHNHKTGEPGSSRSDINVTDYRNFLFEMDGVSLERQQEILNQVSELATTIVYSGGKSYHMIISMADNLGWEPHTVDSVQKYKQLWQCIADRIDEIAGEKVIDSSCKNPARLTRCPGTARGDKTQDLIYIGKLKTMADLRGAGINPDYSFTPKSDFEGIDERLLSVEALRAMMSPAVQMSIDYASLWAASAGMYPEIYRLTMWAIDDAGAPKSTLIRLFWEQCFPILLKKGYPEYKLEKAIHDAYREKGA